MQRDMIAFEGDECDILVRQIRAIGEMTRLRLLTILAEHEGQFHVEQLAEQFGMAQPTISHHLGKLLDAQLIEAHRHGLYMYYHVRWPVLYHFFESIERLFGVKAVLQSTRGN